MISKEIEIQENEYSFPYHYVTGIRKGVFTQTFDDPWGINYLSTMEFLLGKLSQFSFSSILDIGCGDGRFTRELHKEFPTTRVAGIDSSKKAIFLAQAMNQDFPEIEFLARDISKCQVGQFDAAILMEVFEHIPPKDCQHFLYSIFNLLREDGILLATVPHENKPIEPKHFQHFSSSKVKLYFEPLFSISEMVFFEHRSCLMNLISQVFSNRFFILNHSFLKNWLFSFYKRRLFFTSENFCQRIFFKAVKVKRD